MSNFASLNTALTALRAQRRGLDVTGQNIANANTEGYTRQRVVLESVGAPAVPARYSTSKDVAGGGVTVNDVSRLHDAFLDARGVYEHGKQAFLLERRAGLARLEDVFGEPSTTGIQAQLAEVWRGWHDVANRPGDLAARSQLLQRANTLADGVRNTHATIEAQWHATRDQLVTIADEVSSTAATVAELNDAIRRSMQTGLPANELSDKRDGLVLKLADLVGAVGRPTADGVVDVYVGGSALVRGTVSQRLTVSGTTEFPNATTDPVRLVWSVGDFPAVIETGQAGGNLDVLQKMLPGYAARLDAFAADLAGQVNAVHADGYQLDGTKAGAFFSGTTASTMRVAVKDAAGVGASEYAGGKIDGGIATRVAQLASSPTGPDSNYRQVVVDLGVDAQTANRRSQIQVEVTMQVDAARDAQAGVDLDEEMVNMLSYQRAYEGAARVMTAIDQMLDKLINSTGLVGR